MTFDQSTPGSYDGVLSGSGTLTKSGSGVLTLSRTNLYSGDTNVTGGTLSISADANLGTGGTVNLGEGTTLAFTAGGVYTHDVTVTGDPIFDTNGNTVIENGLITNGGSPPAGEVVVTGGGTLALGNAANSYSGGTKVIQGSTVTINDNGELGALTGGLTLGDTTTSGTLATISDSRLGPGHHAGGRRRQHRREGRNDGDAQRDHRRRRRADEDRCRHARSSPAPTTIPAARRSTPAR